MSEETPRERLFQPNFQKNLIAGLLAIIPLVVVWLVFRFLFETLSSFGRPLADSFTDFLRLHVPAVAPVIADGRVRWVTALLLSLLILYCLGAVTNRVLGQRVWAIFEGLINRIPLVQTVYSAARKLVDVLRTKPDNSQRVVLIDFPHEGAKTIGFVMRTFTDAITGEDVAAVYVPTAVNPTTGYLQLLPVAKLVPSDMPADQAMAMVISAGAVMPERMTLTRERTE